MQASFPYVLQLGDNALILSHRLSEWCGHGPVLEQDIALTNIALDLLGQARLLLTYAGEIEGLGRTEDDLASFRDAHQFRNVLLVEQPNGDWAHTIVRQFFFDAYHYYHYQALLQSRDERLAAIAQKALKEVTYHLRYSSEWTIRLGDGTEESHRRMQEAVDDLWMYTGELTTPNEVEREAAEAGVGSDLTQIRPLWEAKVREVLEEATLQIPGNSWMQSGGKDGRHTEHLGYILAEMQFLQRAYPGLQW
ncbi:MAG: 1,2-phenylacetyl-CoA epoxidase subunit PaaC [Saprospiraceae bacterium]|nr:phenylacetate-CoA oxygenase subunit PaaC [Saprospiraceae bacterium]MDW8229949.1 1,2-phenylacetyl-CoA epoxidase subunit PaaC [Saprospiraceae bacterium]